MKRLCFALLALWTLPPVSLRADVRLPAVLDSHMVLQQRSTAMFWGWAAPAEKVTITASWSTNSYVTNASNGARWSVGIPTPAAGGPHTIRIQAGNTIVLEDVLVGEVWLCSGQSNMEWSGEHGLKQSLEEMPQATHSQLRLFHVPKSTAAYPQEDLAANWVVCSPEAMRRFSAIGYFFGKRLNERLGVPVGLINASWGGTPAEVWTPRSLVESDPELKAAAAELKPAAWWPHEPGLTYNAMIHPLTPFRVAGFLWYQGESNVNTHGTYRRLFRTMIGAWREAWQADLPFYFVQIAPFTYGDDHLRAAFLREAQAEVAMLPGTGMVVTTDLVDNVKDIHPQQKREVALRLADLALADIYGVAGLQPRSPRYRSHAVETGRIRIQFDALPTGLVSRGGPPTEFTIAGDDGRFVPATAVIEGATVVVSAPTVAEPKAVRFGFNNTSMPNLFSAEGLPVAPFRTDR
ncbi:MAG: sialate O-acetylesterase [Verrucomicrobia bacterium]|nr:sialate O-acetylesterase [Verrucomicrobiota bacterium]